MFLYWSGWTGTGTSRDPFVPAVAAAITTAGGKWAAVDLRTVANQNTATGRCLVGSTVLIAPPAAPAQFLLDTATGLDDPLPANVRTAINSQLGITIPTGLTWRTMFRRLMTVDGAGRWGTIVGDLLLKFGPAGAFDL